MIARVFARRTRATPVDQYAFYDEPGLILPTDITEVHVSCTFTWDIPRAEYLARSWARLGVPVLLGGPAFGLPGSDFIPGQYLRPGYVITSRGCNNKCWFCYVWRREGKLRELPITDGWNVLDDNLLSCSESHIRDVFAMLKRQNHPVEFTGGLEAKLLKPWHVELLANLKPKQMFFAYDTLDDYEPLICACRMLLEAGFTLASHSLRAYVLIGYPSDTLDAAEHRLRRTIEAGFMPMAMLYRDDSGKTESEWRRFQRLWARPALIASRKCSSDISTKGGIMRAIDALIKARSGMEPADYLRQQVEAGLTVRQIARNLGGISHTALLRRLKAAKIDYNRRDK